MATAGTTCSRSSARACEPQQRRLTVFFKGDALERFEGDTMPSEAEFVATLDNSSARRQGAACCEATEEQLQRASTPAQAAAAPQPAAAPAPAAPATTRRSSPPLTRP